MDWAPDWMIEYVVNFLIKNHVKATWFFTHFSPAIETIKQKVDLFEISTEWTSILGKDIWLDNIYLSNLDTATVRTNEATYIYENHDNVNKKISVFPNPMKNHAVITSVFSPGNPVDADIYSIAGIKIRTLLKGYVSPGTLQIYWDGVGDNGSEGISFCNLFCEVPGR